jgi:TrmH RNA methyltransferase
MSKKINRDKPVKKPTTEIKGVKFSVKSPEIKIYGENACLAVFNNRPQDIIQLFITKEMLKKVSHITKYCAQNKKAYHLVEREEIEAMTKATHHEDICMLIKKAPVRTLEQYLAKKSKTSLIVALENVSNPHNIGAILRNAAHFGADAILVSDRKVAEAASAIRTSEGGFLFVEVFETKDFKKTLTLLSKDGHQIVTTSSHAKESLYDLKWQQKVVILFGEEAHGLSKDLLEAGVRIKIPGTDHVESLNVSVASAVILSDYYQKVKTNEINPRFK